MKFFTESLIALIACATLGNALDTQAPIFDSDLEINTNTGDDIDNTKRYFQP